MLAARHAFKDIRPKLKLAANPPIENYFEPLEVKRYLLENHLKFCVLVVDAETVKDAYDKLPSKRRVEYEDLLETAAREVGKIACLFFLQLKKKGLFPRGIQLDGVGVSYGSTSIYMAHT